MDRVTVELDKELKQKIRIYCAENNISIKEFILNLIIEKFK